MREQLPSYVHAYSDDIIRLRQAWEILRRDPGLFQPITEAFLCRMAAVFIVGNLEGMMKHWKEEWGGGPILDSFLRKKDDKGNRLSNKQRVERLALALLEHGVEIDREILLDFCAVILLRNVIVHSIDTEDASPLIAERGFPSDVMRLREEHWNKMHRVNEAMVGYILASWGADEFPTP